MGRFQSPEKFQVIAGSFYFQDLESLLKRGNAKGHAEAGLPFWLLEWMVGALLTSVDFGISLCPRVIQV